MIELALEINRLQFEIGELFVDIKNNIKTDKYDEFKKSKKYWNQLIENLYENYLSEDDIDKEGYINKLSLFDILILILKKTKKCYSYDEELKYLK